MHEEGITEKPYNPLVSDLNSKINEDLMIYTKVFPFNNYYDLQTNENEIIQEFNHSYTESTVKMKEVNLSADFEEIGQGSENLGNHNICYTILEPSDVDESKVNNFDHIMKLGSKRRSMSTLQLMKPARDKTFTSEDKHDNMVCFTCLLNNWFIISNIQNKLNGYQNSTAEKVISKEKRISDIDRSFKSIQKSFNGMIELIVKQIY